MHNSWNCLNIAEMYRYTHDVHDFDIHIFADEVDQVDHSMIKKLYLPFQNESLYFEHNTLR